MNRDEATSIMEGVLNRYGDYANNKSFGLASDWILMYANIRSLGNCNLTTKVITINAEYAEHAPREAVIDTIRHECAHALCGIEVSRSGRRMAHGRMWRVWARRVGANDRAKSKGLADLGKYGDMKVAERVAKPKKDPKWVIVLDRGDRLEKVTHAGRRHKNLAAKMVKGDRSTMGKLYHVETAYWKRYNGDRDKLVGYRLLVR